MFTKALKSIITLNAEESLNIYAVDEFENKDSITFAPCGEYQESKIGFVPLADDGEFVRSVVDYRILQVGISVKKVNKNKLKKLTAKEIERLIKEAAERGEELNPTKDFKKDIEEQIRHSLLPETESTEKFSYVIYDTTNNRLHITGVTKNLSEDITAFIRSVTESLPVTPCVEDTLAVVHAFNECAINGPYNRFTLGEYIVLENEEGKVVWSKESLYQCQDKIEEIVGEGKHVTTIGLEFDGIIKLIVNSEFNLTGVKFPKNFSEETSFDGDVILCMKEIRSVFEDLKEMVDSK